MVTFERLSLREITQYLVSGQGPPELQTHLRFVKMVYTHNTKFRDAFIFGTFPSNLKPFACCRSPRKTSSANGEI